MAVEIRIPHRLALEEAAARIVALAGDHDVGLVPDPDGRGGSIEKATPVGAVHGRYVVEGDAVVVTIEKKPAFLPEATVRRVLEENLRAALAGE
ncbi:MAG: hypothetical protein O7B99_02225 [Planctomycetota bacterium]|nr:hypothetical protein [Planctomycetota bacterium]